MKKITTEYALVYHLKVNDQLAKAEQNSFNLKQTGTSQ